MLAIAGNARIFFFQKPVDMRKGVESLSVLIENSCSGELMSGAYFIFINRSRNRMKVLYWDNDGFAIWWKRLEKGSFRLAETDKLMINRKEFFMLLEGITPHKIQRRFQLN